MAKVKVREHEVIALKIIAVNPLTQNGQFVSPDAGLGLTLEDETVGEWVPTDGCDVEPRIGDYLVKDESVRTTYLVPAADFANLFEATLRQVTYGFGK